MAQFNFKAIGTTWKMDIYEKFSGDKKEVDAREAEILFHIMARIELFDKAYSRFREDSLVTDISRGDERNKSGKNSESREYILPDDAKLMMDLYHDLYVRTEGLVTPLIGQLISDAGYDAKYSLQAKEKLQSPPEWEEAIDYKYPILTVKKPVLLDFGAIGKGYLIDLVAKVLEADGVAEYCIDAGGDILHKGVTPIRVGLENPNNLGQVVGVYTLGNGSICGSAGTRRKWHNKMGDFTHIINPVTMVSPKDVTAVWVTAETAMLADAIATCLFFVGAEKLSKKDEKGLSYSFEYLLIKSNRLYEKSPGFAGEMFV